jgi:hypothetical protein
MKVATVFFSAALVGMLCFYPLSARADCACACVDAEPFMVCTGFIESVTTADECSSTLDCSIVEQGEPEGPPGFVCRSRHVYDTSTGNHELKHACHPGDLGEGGDWGKTRGRG